MRSFEIFQNEQHGLIVPLLDISLGKRENLRLPGGTELPDSPEIIVACDGRPSL